MLGQKLTEKMRKTTFAAGKTRLVCVSRSAIEENLRRHTNYPTVLVIEDGEKHEFHSAIATGCLYFDRTRDDLPAKVFIETDREIEAFTDLYGDASFFNRPIVQRPSLWSRFWHRIHLGFSYVPIVSCFIPEPTEPKVVSRPVVSQQRSGC